MEDTLLFNSESLNLIVTFGSMLETIKLPLEAERILGGTKDTQIRRPDSMNQCAGDPHIYVEEFFMAGVHDYLGSSNIVIRQY